MNLRDLEVQGFLETLDVELARALGRMSESSSSEVELAVALASRSVRRGHACVPLRSVQDELVATHVSDLPNVERWAAELTDSRLLDRGPLVLDDAQRLYLRRYWQFENDIAEELSARASERDDMIAASAAILKRLFEAEESARRVAAERALTHRVSVLCGGPGTGKTTTVASIVAALLETRLQPGGDDPKVLLLAPTGKAAARLGEAVSRAKEGLRVPQEVRNLIPEEATTVHRALGMRRHGMRFLRDADSPVDADIIVLDEASMVDLGLMRQLLIATRRDATLLIVGDPDQLTSVEAGSVLRDLVRADEETWWTGRVTHLTKTYRYDATEPLGELVQAIRSGDVSQVQSLFEGGAAGLEWSDLDQLEPALDRAAGRWVGVLETDDLDQHFERRRGFIALTPFRRGRIGTTGLGHAIESRLGPQSHQRQPIIVEENSHELGIYNGDLGVLYDEDGKTVAAIQREGETPQRVVEARLPRFSAAYALSVHKAQGSEFDEVLVVLPHEDAPLLTRELLYTAVSRARFRLRVVGPLEVIGNAVSRRAQRHSGLVDRIAAQGA